MTNPSQRPRSRRIQARVMRAVNIPMRLILGLPFPTPLGGRLMLVYFTGRKTGRRYRQPLSYVRQGTTLLTPGGGNWKRNLQSGEPVRIRLRGHDRSATPEIVTDPETIESLLRIMTAANPMVSRFVGIPRNSDGRPDPQRLSHAVKHGFAIVRWRLDEPAADRSSNAPRH
jgi:deazaflavin-dependent oxidoreductase (nitroreductase family)